MTQSSPQLVISGLKRQPGHYAYVEVPISTVITEKIGEFCNTTCSSDSKSKSKKKNIINKIVKG